jgi:23S rRNA A2030 N6-methylase RlmJ
MTFKITKQQRIINEAINVINDYRDKTLSMWLPTNKSVKIQFEQIVEKAEKMGIENLLNPEFYDELEYLTETSY